MDKLNYIPVSDGVGIIGYHWSCDCGRMLYFVSNLDECECGFILPDIDPDDWYEEQLSKDVLERDWNKEIK